MLSDIVSHARGLHDLLHRRSPKSGEEPPGPTALRQLERRMDLDGSSHGTLASPERLRYQSKVGCDSRGYHSKCAMVLPLPGALCPGVSSLADHYLIEGVDFLPAQVARLSAQYPIRAVFLGCSQLTLEDLA